MHDVVIVGAGPAGSATAHFLGRSGLDVMLLDRSEFPRDKTCGDGLTPRALRVLDKMAILDDVARQGCQVKEYEVVAPNGRTTSATITGHPGALVVPRRSLDETILRRATDSGARFAGRVTVSHVEPTATTAKVHADGGHTFEGRMAVIATGAAFGVHTRSGILRRKPQTMLAARAYFEDLQQEVAASFQVRFDGAPLTGYGWVFPTGKRGANIGIGFLPRRHSGTAGQAFDRFVAGKATRSMLSGARQVGPARGYPIRVDFLRSPTFAERTLLVGEAAGLVNPLTGEGIDYALESGNVAADFLAARLDTGDLSAESVLDYHRLLHARFGELFRFSEHVRNWFYSPLLLNVFVPLANRRPELRQLLANILLGEREPRGYGPLTMLGRLLIYLVRTSLRSHMP